jgi:nucleotide-binding universal stress UspA family protein
MWKNILLPVDGTGIDSNITSLIAGGLAPKGTRLLILHVVPSAATASATPGRALEKSEQLAKTAEAYVEGIVRKLSVRGRKSEGIVAYGDPVRQIVAAAKTAKADLVVMGTHSRKGLDRWLSGSVAEAVATKTKCPVLVLHSPATKRK